MRKILFLFILLSTVLFAKAEYINIGILANQKVTSLSFAVRAGEYTLFSQYGKVTTLKSGSKLNISYKNGEIEVMQSGKRLGTFTKVNLMGTGWYNHFMISTKAADKLERRYDDNLKISVAQSKLKLINNIDLDNYVSGVVEAEVGRKPPKEYFKLQAIICRTYALSNTHKHLFEGFNLCDQVHCQAYHGKTFFPAIVDAAMQTRGAVIVDSDIQLITAAFHSNCGGETVNSEDVWTKSLYYLRSVRDTFCTNKRNSYWEKEIAKSSWDRYLSAKHLKVQEQGDTSYPAIRTKFYPESQVSFEDFRHQFKLRSTYFNFSNDATIVKLKGRGYGHGVGLCQEGAMEMAALGYNYSEILHFYYSGVHIIDLAALHFFKED